MTPRSLFTRTLSATLLFGALSMGSAQAAPQGDIDFGFAPEPGDATYGFVPSNVPEADVVAIIVDRSGPMTSGVILLTGGRTIEFSGVESHPFALTEAYEHELVAVVEK